jgi:hypothetical protein
VVGVRGKKRRAGRELADLLSAYGNVKGRALTPLEEWQAWLNLPRVRLRQALALAQALGLGRGDAPPGADLADAWANTEEEAGAAHVAMVEGWRRARRGRKGG